MQQHTDRLLGLVIAIGLISASAMPPSELVMVCCSSQSVSSAESGNDSVNSLSTTTTIRKMTGYSNIMRQELGNNTTFCMV